MDGLSKRGYSLSGRQRAGIVPDQALKARVKALVSAKSSAKAISAIVSFS